LPDSLLTDARPNFQPGERQHRQLQELVAFNQKVGHLAQGIVGGGNTAERFWSKAQPKSAGDWKAATQWYRDYYRDEIIGSFTKQMVPADPQSRKIFEKPSWVAYEVVLNVLPELFIWA